MEATTLAGTVQYDPVVPKPNCASIVQTLYLIHPSILPHFHRIQSEFTLCAVPTARDF